MTMLSRWYRKQEHYPAVDNTVAIPHPTTQHSYLIDDISNLKQMLPHRRQSNLTNDANATTTPPQTIMQPHWQQ